MDSRTKTEARADAEDGQIEGYSSTSSSPSSSSSPSKSCSIQQDEDLDLNDVERILSRPALSRRILALFEAPEFVQRLRSYDEAQLGDSVTFSAQYTALPKPTVKWFKDEEEVRPTHRHELDESSSEAEGRVIRLIIHDVVASDEGAYKCKVENREGVASTTGYLSVAGKPSQRSRSNRTSGNLPANDQIIPGVSTPPSLRPIVEQKSMEEREEMELSRQPPSPLQDFIDGIKRSAKSKHGPIFYGTGDIFAAQDDASNSEDEIFSTDSYTPTGTPDNGLESENSDVESTEEDGSCKTICVCAMDSFQSPEIDWNPHSSETPVSPATPPHNSHSPKEDSIYDLDNAEDKCSVDPKNEAENVPLRISREFRRTRLGHLQLKHRLAIDLPENNTPIAETLPDVVQTPSPTETAIHPDNSSITDNLLNCESHTDRSSTIGKAADEIMLDVVVNRLVDSLDSPDVQFYVVFVTCIATVAAALRIPPLWLVFLVAVASVIRFSTQKRRSKRCVFRN